MAEITKEKVVDLREKTGAGLIDCKRALVESDGDVEEAVALLRKKGVATAAKKAGREAGEGVIACIVASAPPTPSSALQPEFVDSGERMCQCRAACRDRSHCNH